MFDSTLFTDHTEETTNWTNSEHYEHISNRTSLSFWAWQFLRRNSEYKKRWLEFREQCVDHAKFGKQHNEIRLYAINRKEFANEWTGKVPQAVMMPLGRLWGLEFGLSHMYNPTHFDFQFRSFKIPPKVFIPFTPLPSPPDETGSPMIGKTQNLLPLVVDLSYPIDQILKAVEQNIEGFHEDYREKGGAVPKPTKLHFKKWALYLRVLDAHMESVAVRKIARTLFDDTETGRSSARNHLNAAVKFRDGGYREILTAK